MFESLSLQKIALILFVICAVWVIARGIARMLLNSVLFVLSGFLAYKAWEISPQFVNQNLTSFHKVKPLWLDVGIPVAAFLASFALLRKLASMIISPMLKGDSLDSKPAGFQSVIMRLIFAAVPTSLLGGIGVSAFHHLGTISEIQKVNGNKKAIEERPEFLLQGKKAIAALIPEKYLTWIDPLTQPDRVKLAKMISSNQADKSLKTVIDPDTGKPIPRAIPVMLPELEELKKAGDYGAILRHPELTKALENPRVQSFLK